MDNQRIIDLEAKFAHQDHAIEGLQKAVYEQQKAIDKLQEIVRRQLQRINDLASGGPDFGPTDEKPPHY